MATTQRSTDEKQSLKGLSDLVAAVGMTMLSGPEVDFAAGNDKTALEIEPALSS